MVAAIPARLSTPASIARGAAEPEEKENPKQE
jgi:hypothetical protein